MLTFYHAHYLFIYQCMYLFTHAWEKNARPPDIDKRYIITIDFRDSISTLKSILTIYILALLYILGWYMTTHYWDVIMGAMASQITSLNYDCLLNRSFRRRSKKTSKLRVTGLCAGNSPMTGEFPAQMDSNAESVSIWWRHHFTFYSVPHSGSFNSHLHTRIGSCSRCLMMLIKSFMYSVVNRFFVLQHTWLITFLHSVNIPILFISLWFVLSIVGR